MTRTAEIPIDVSGPTERGRDAAWVKRALAGDGDAFRSLVEHYKRRVYRVARGILGHREEALDVTQEAFLRVYRSLRRFRTGQSFSIWIHRIVINLSIDACRRRPPSGQVSLDHAPGLAHATQVPGAGLREAERKHRVRAVLERLPWKYRVVLLLRDVEGFPSTRVARILGCTHATARWRLHRARRTFRALWESELRPRSSPTPALEGCPVGGGSCPAAFDA
jgi:RNA polymerase sigma-70 factor (ECF subfamily)